jgi:hypothetical protein
MTWFDHTFLEGAGFLFAGGLAGYWLLCWKDRRQRAAALLTEQTLLENARREAETVLRE